jgi:hypothetical protein
MFSLLFVDSFLEELLSRVRKGSDLSTTVAMTRKAMRHTCLDWNEMSDMSVDVTTADSSPTVNPNGDVRHSRIPELFEWEAQRR